MKMKLFKNVFVVALSLVVMASCKKDDINVNTSRVNVALKTSKTITKNGGTPATEAFVLNEFILCFGEIEFDINDDMEDALPGNAKTFSDIELDGPFLVDLMSTDAETGIDIGAANVPNAIYEEIEFDIEPYTLEEPAEMFDNSILAKGTYEGAAFTIVSTQELELEIEYPNGYTLDGTDSRLFIDLNLGTLKTLVEAIDFTNAVKEEDGSILINKDKNADILAAFENAVENSFEVEEEGDDDED